MRIPSGITDQYIYFVAVDSTDFTTRETGLSSFTVYRSRDGAASSAMTTPTINETDATNMPGVYELLLDEDMTIGSGNDSEEMVFHITHAGMAPVTRTIELYRPKITAGYTLGVGSDGDLLEVNTLTGHTAQTADHAAGIANIPTVAEFNARTLAAASYFDPAADTVANVTTVATLTGHTAQTGDNYARIGVNGAGLTDCLTATGFSTHSAADVYTAFGTGANLTACLTATGFATPANVTAAQAAIIAQGDAAWATAAGFATPANVTDARDAVLTQGNLAWTTATGFSMHSAADVYTAFGDGSNLTAAGSGDDAATNYAYFTSLSREDAFKATGFSTHSVVDVRTEMDANSTKLSTIETNTTSSKSATDKLDTAMELDGATYRFTANALEQAPAGGGGGGCGDGDTQYTNILRETDGITPIPDAKVYVTTDSDGLNVVDFDITDDFGSFTFTLNSGGTYFLVPKKTGFNFGDPTEFTVS